MKKKFTQIKMWLISASIIVTVLVSLLMGNPLFAFFAENTAVNYIAENYPGCYVEEIVYDGIGIFSGYRAIIKSENNLSFEKIIYIDITGLTINHKAMEFFNE